MLHRRLLTRAAAVVVPAAMVLGATGTALAAKPPRTPKPTVTQTPEKFTKSRSATFAWDVVAGTAYTCSLNGATYTTCSSPTTYSGLVDRVHTFALRAKQSTGKFATYSYSWTVDNVAPTAPKVSPVAGPTSNTNASISFSDGDTSVTGFTCALDSGAPVACASPQPYSGLTDATHTVTVTAHDAAGNTASSAVSWVVDAHAPNIPVVTGPVSPTNQTAASVAFSGEEGATFTCALDTEAAAPCTSPWTRSGLAEGSHTLTVTPHDAVQAGTPGTATWVVDLTPPAAPKPVSGPAATTNDPDFTVRFAAGDLETAGYVCTFAGVTASCGSPFTPAVTPVNGPYALSVRAVDQAGNRSAPLDVSWTFDSAAPSPAEFVSGPATPTNDVNPTFDFVDTDTSTDHFTCAVDALAVLDPCQPGVALSALTGGAGVTDGAHAMSLVAVDGVGNGSAPVLWHWTQDTTGPVSQPNSGAGGPAPGDQGAVSTTPTYVFSSNDPTVAGFVCSLDGGDWTPCTSGFTPSVGDGTHTLQVATVDQAGNRGTPITYTWTLDTHAPVGALTFPSTLAGPARVSFGEDVLGVSTSTVRLLVSGTSTAVPTTTTCLDAAGHAASCGGAVRSVVLNHAARLVPGQRYAFSVSPAVHDAAGNPASAPASVYRALRVLQESELSAVQGWAPRTSTAAYGGKYLQAKLPGAAASYPFRGTSVTWYTATGPAMGTVKVYCGSTLKSTVNNYAAKTTWHVARTVRCSSATASSTLRLVATGLKGSRLGKGTLVVLDAVKVGTTRTSNPAVLQRWAAASSTLASKGRYAVADQSGESVQLTFRGTSLTWRTLLGKGMGKAKVYVDGTYKGTYDQFASSTKAGSRTWKLTDKVHTVKIVVTGTHRTGATGSRVVVDALTIG